MTNFPAGLKRCEMNKTCQKYIFGATMPVSYSVITPIETKPFSCEKHSYAYL